MTCKQCKLCRCDCDQPCRCARTHLHREEDAA